MTDLPKTERTNWRVVLKISDMRVDGTGERHEANIRGDAQMLIRFLKQHIEFEEGWEPELLYDIREVCPYCGEEWKADLPEKRGSVRKAPICCDEAQNAWWDAAYVADEAWRKEQSQ